MAIRSSCGSGIAGSGPVTATRVAIVLLVAVVALGPLYTAPGYSAIANVISELAAQNTPRNWLMSGAFVALGAAVAYEGIRDYRRALLPFIGFGLFFGAVGLFGHKPITPGVPFIPWVHDLHSGLATASGVALTVGFVWQAVRGHSTSYRLLAAALAVVCVALPLLMLASPPYQGAIQRLMYLAVFGWLWRYYPRQVDAGQGAVCDATAR